MEVQTCRMKEQNGVACNTKSALFSFHACDTELNALIAVVGRAANHLPAAVLLPRMAMRMVRLQGHLHGVPGAGHGHDHALAGAHQVSGGGGGVEGGKQGRKRDKDNHVVVCIAASMGPAAT